VESSRSGGDWLVRVRHRRRLNLESSWRLRCLCWGVAVQFAFIGEAARALGQANYQGRSMAVNPAANQSAAAGEIILKQL